HPFARHLLQGRFQDFDGTLNVRLYDYQQFLYFCFAQGFDAAFGRLDERALALCCLAVTRDLLRPGDIGDDLETFPGLRHALKTEDFDRHGGTSFVNRLTAVIEHRTDLAEALAYDERIADVYS